MQVQEEVRQHHNSTITDDHTVLGDERYFARFVNFECIQ